MAACLVATCAAFAVCSSSGATLSAVAVLSKVFSGNQFFCCLVFSSCSCSSLSNTRSPVCIVCILVESVGTKHPTVRRSNSIASESNVIHEFWLCDCSKLGSLVSRRISCILSMFEIGRRLCCVCGMFGTASAFAAASLAAAVASFSASPLAWSAGFEAPRQMDAAAELIGVAEQQ